MIWRKNMFSPDDERSCIFYPTGLGGISERTRWNVLVTGCGGTGSFIAHTLAQLKASNTREGSALGRIVLIDPDVVEERNVGRQNFAFADVGTPKSQALAWRYNLAFGIDMEWHTVPFAASLLPKRQTSIERIVLIGAVDSGSSRREIAGALHARKDEIVWLDSGNGETRGQVAIGNTFVGEELFSSVDPGVNVARYLPYPSLSLPELLEEDPEPTPSCAEAVENQEQGLYVNRFMAGIVGEYLRRLISGELAVFQTWVDLSSLEMASVPVNQYHISRLSRLQEHSKSASIKVGKEVLV
jgi:PRTRC genetic system ThiF family protein